ncbi:MAG: ABC transporter substrate-binding protein [Bryobacteraceae bacterium]|nr:ABC transporter substrate-binding protein [Bryobacteraceae bacterium]
MGVAFLRLALVAALASGVAAQERSELRFCLRADPRTFDPLLAAEDASEAVRYLTAGTLLRLNRQTQKLEPELAKSWTVRDNGKRIDFTLREGVRFSDGAPFGPADVAATVRRLTDPELTSAIADTFRSSGGRITAAPTGPQGVSVFFSAPVAGVESLFDQLAISPARQVPPEKAVLGPFMLDAYKAGQYVLLKRNPHYWRSSAGKRLPRLETIRLDIQSNREIELARFRRGKLHFVDKLAPEAFERLRKEAPAMVVDAGPSLDTEFLWFNQVPDGPLAPHKRRWFQSRRFRRAVSAAINRDDLIRLAYRGYARPAVGPVSQANRQWWNSRLTAHKHDPAQALDLLRQDGFRLDGKTLRDRDGNSVEFSLITNAGSRPREQIGAMVQHDLLKIGIRVNFTPIEFQSLIERITRTNAYDACLLGLSNVEIDPNTQTNLLVSSGTHHAWNPRQAKPATEWEAEIDRLMSEQAAAPTLAARKKAFDRVQEVLAEQVPIVFLLHPDVLLGVSPKVRGAAPSALPPHLFWNIPVISLAPPQERRSH